MVWLLSTTTKILQKVQQMLRLDGLLLVGAGNSGGILHNRLGIDGEVIKVYSLLSSLSENSGLGSST